MSVVNTAISSESIQYPIVSEYTETLLLEIQKILGEKLMGLYLYGSATAGDFDSNLSDIDLLAVISDRLTKNEFIGLEEMHNKFAIKFPEWKDRIEVTYATQEGLKSFRDKRSEIAEISPGEAFHFKDAGNDWLINWYIVRENGKTLFGAKITEIIPIILKEEYIAAVKIQALSWSKRISGYSEKSTRGSVAYAIFTMCRAMYSFYFGEQATKKQAALWIVDKFPQWKELIANAIKWREVQWLPKQEVIGDDLPMIIKFVNFAVDQIENNKL